MVCHPLAHHTFTFALLDTLIGMIPFTIGNVLDFFSKANIKNLKLITLYVEGDKETICEVNSKAVKMALLILLLCVAIYLVGMLIAKLFVWLYGVIVS